jgi:hypothetical protein
MSLGRRNRDEAAKAEEQAVRLSARGLTDREIGVALGLSESEARRKRRLGLERRGRQLEEGTEAAFIAARAELEEALRTAYRDHDDAAPGTPARVGFLKLILDLIVRRSRLRGIDLEKPGLAIVTPVAAPTFAAVETLDDRQRLLRQSAESLTAGVRAAVELGLHSAPGDVRPPAPADEGADREEG